MKNYNLIRINSDSGNIYPNCSLSKAKDFKFTDTESGIDFYRYVCSTASYVFAAMIVELIGSFFFIFFFLTQTEESTRFGKEKAINCFIISSAYIGARAMLNGKNVTLSGAVLNPAIGIGTNFTMLFQNGGMYFQYVWIYGLLPIGGAVLAVIFYELVFKKTQEVLTEGEPEDDGEDNLLDK